MTTPDERPVLLLSVVDYVDESGESQSAIPAETVSRMLRALSDVLPEINPENLPGPACACGNPAHEEVNKAVALAMASTLQFCRDALARAADNFDLSMIESASMGAPQQQQDREGGRS